MSHKLVLVLQRQQPKLVSVGRENHPSWSEWCKDNNLRWSKSKVGLTGAGYKPGALQICLDGVATKSVICLQVCLNGVYKFVSAVRRQKACMTVLHTLLLDVSSSTDSTVWPDWNNVTSVFSLKQPVVGPWTSLGSGPLCNFRSGPLARWGSGPEADTLFSWGMSSTLLRSPGSGPDCGR